MLESNSFRTSAVWIFTDVGVSQISKPNGAFAPLWEYYNRWHRQVDVAVERSEQRSQLPSGRGGGFIRALESSPLCLESCRSSRGITHTRPHSFSQHLRSLTSSASQGRMSAGSLTDCRAAQGRHVSSKIFGHSTTVPSLIPKKWSSLLRSSMWSRGFIFHRYILAINEKSNPW